MSYIIVSDVHLGNRQCDYTKNYMQFCAFLKWLKDLDINKATVKCEDKEITISRLEKIILLGDILDLWDPIDGDRNNVIKYSLEPFSLLSDINCEKIYVVGNHDDSIKGYEHKINNVMLANKTKLNIRNRHYPEEPLTIGDRTYFFLHGHQFDKVQAIPIWLSNTLGEDPIKWLQDLYNITFTKLHWTKILVVFIILALVGVIFWKSLLQISPLGLTIWAWIIGFLGLGIIVPGVVAKIQRGIYDLGKTKDRTIYQLIEEGYYQNSKDSLHSDVVVFGHTHLADYYALDRSEGKKRLLFLNTGCWVGDDSKVDEKANAGVDKRYANTFTYIDESGAYVFKWDYGTIKCIIASPVHP